MRIGLDARTILGPKTGDRSYTLNLLRCLPDADPALAIVALLDAEPPAELARMLPEAVEVAVSPRPRGKLWTAIALPRAVRRLKLDLIHLQYIAPLRLPCPYVCTIHDISFRLFPEWFNARDRWLMNALIPRSVRRAERVIVPSACTAQDIRAAYGVGEERIRVTPYAAGAEFLNEVSPQAVASVCRRHGLQGPYMLFVGTLQPRKNLPRLLEAFAAADAGGITLAIAGKQGWRLPRLEGLIGDLGLGERVRLLGYVPDADLPGLYAGSLAFLFSTLYEGFGLPVLEAMSVGTPVLTSSVSALPEVAGEGALLVDPRSVEEIANAISRLATDRSLREALSEAGRVQAQRFSWEQTAAKTAGVYREVLARPWPERAASPEEGTPGTRRE